MWRDPFTAMITRTLLALMASAATVFASPLLEYTFSSAGSSQASSGSNPAALVLHNSSTVPTDLTSTGIDGVAGAGDRYLDTQSSAGSYGQHAAAVAGLSGVSQFTFAGWINTSNVSQGGGRIFDLYNSSNQGYHLVGQPSGALRLVVDGLTANSATGLLEADTWVFVAVTYDGTATSNNVRFHKGGRLTAVSTTTTSLNAGVTNAQTVRFTVGKDDGLGSGVFAGRFDNLRFYDRVLTEGELEALRAADAPAAPPPAQELLLEYAFDGAGILEPSGGAVDVNLALGDAAGQPLDVTGRSFPGVRGAGDRYLDLVTNPGAYGQHAVDEDAIDGLTAFTLSGWINTDSVSQAGSRIVDNFDNTNGFRFVGQPSGAVRLVVDQPSPNNITTPSNFLEAGQWIFFAITYDGASTSNNVRIYKGKREASVSTPFHTGTINAGPVNNDNAKFTVGKDRSLGGNAFIGRYDNIRLHRGVLTAAEIDALRAADVANYVEPPVLGAVVDVTQAPYFADNTGATDTTSALQAALSDNQFKNRTLYFPNGTYTVSRPLFISTDNANAGFTHLRGESRTGTVLRLRDNSDGTLGSANFGDPANPRIMLNFFVGPWTNNGYYHSVEDMTFDIGSGNPGAIALEFQSNNVGWMENVTIRTSDPERRGYIGLKIDRNLVGMGIVRNVSVDGFDYGIRTGHYHAAFVFEDVTVTNQHVAGLWNFQKPISLRRFTSHNTVPALLNTDPAGQIVVIDSTFTGGDGTASAIENDAGYLFARNVTTSGYASAVRNQGVVVPGESVSEYVSDQRFTLWDDTPATSLDLPVVDLPFAPIDVPADVYVVDGDAQGDDTAAIQAAIDSGKTTVYLPLGDYTVSDTIRIRGNVRRILGQQSTLVATQSLRGSEKPVLLYEDGGTQPTVWIERIKSNFQASGRHTWIQHNSSNDLVLRHVFIAYGKAYRNEGTGRLFMEDVAAGGANEVMEEIPAFIFKDQEVWAWQFDPEGCLPHVINDGGRLWVFGFKVGENHGPYFYTVNGGQTELLGGVVNELTYDEPPADRAILINDNSDTFAIFVERTRLGDENPAPVVIRERRDQEVRELLNGDVPLRLADYTEGAVVPFYRGRTGRGTDLPIVDVVAAPSRVEEDAVVPATFTFIVSHASDTPLELHYTLVGDAMNGGDYLPAPSSITLPAGATAVELPIMPIADLLGEDPEQLRLQLLGDSHYLVARSFDPAVLVLQDIDEDLSRGLLARFGFDSGLVDETGQVDPAISFGATLEPQPDGNVAARLPGGGAYLQLAPAGDFGFLRDGFTARTVSLRFRADTTAGTSILFEEGGASHGLGLRIVDGMLHARAVAFLIPTDLFVPIEAGHWHHIALTYDRGRVELHLDGTFVGTAFALRPSTPSHRSPGGLGNGIAGDVFADTVNTGFTGLIDDFAYYTRTLNDREIRSLAGVVRIDQQLVDTGLVTVPLLPGDAALGGTEATLTPLGRLPFVAGMGEATVWRVRNPTGENLQLTLQNANGEVSRTFVATAYADTILASALSTDAQLHQLRELRPVVDTAFPTDATFDDDRLIPLD
jgi:hypothetical protein